MLKEGKLVIGEYRFFQDFFDGQIIKEESEKYKLFKVLLFSVVFAVALFLTFIDIFGIIELALLVFGLVWNIFSGLGKKISYLLCVIVSCLYAIICISFNVYANVLIYLACYIPLQLIATTKDYEDGDFIQIKKHITDYNKILLVLVFISLFMIMIFFDVLTGSRFIIFDALSASLLVCSAVLRNERYFEYYIFRIFALIASVLLWIVVLAEYGNHVNPIIPGFHADPEIMYSEKTNKFYIYATTDGVPGWGGYKFNCFSSDDLVNWKDEGTILDAKSDQVKWANGNAWAPCIEEKKMKDGSYKYYFYYSANAGKRKEIGVAVADSPTGPFVDFGKPIISDSPVGHGQQIDVDVFTDPKSGKSYIYWGNGYMAGAELNDDMTSVKEGTIKVMTPQGGTLKDYNYREAPYVFYRKGKYYFMWSVDDTGSPNYHVAYGTSSSPLGDIKVAEEPVVLIQDPENKIYGTAHNSVLKLPGKDQWYIVYHRINKNYLSRDLGPGFHREVCIDKMTFDKKGRIVPVKPTHDGVEPIVLKKKK